MVSHTTSSTSMVAQPPPLEEEIMNQHVGHILALHLSSSIMVSTTTKTTVPIRNPRYCTDDDDDDESIQDPTTFLGLDHEIPKLCVPQCDGKTTTTILSDIPSSSSSPMLLLYGHLCDMAQTWSQTTFLHRTDHLLQRHMTEFLLTGLSILIQYNDQLMNGSCNDDDDNIAPTATPESLVCFYTTLSTRLLEGVTIRLGSMDDRRRRENLIGPMTLDVT
jgi:hypothetical protein